jgi:K+ transporter
VKSSVRKSEQSPRRQEALFAAMVRNASRVTGYFRLPSKQVVEIGRQISIKE